MSTIEVFTERCIGAGNCADVADGYFSVTDSDGTVIVQRTEVEPGEEPLVERAVNICPVGAIVLHASKP
jgi:ferredoxin